MSYKTTFSFVPVLLFLLSCENKREEPLNATRDSVLGAYKKQISLLQDSVSALSARNSVYGDSLNVLAGKLSESKRPVIVHEKKAKVAPAQNPEANLAQKHLELLEEKIRLLSSSLKVTQDSVKTLENLLVKESADRQAIRVDQQQLRSQLARLSQQNRTLNREIQTLQRTLGSEVKKVAMLKDSIAALAKSTAQQAVERTRFAPGSNELSEAFRILMLAKQLEGADPTLALQFMQEALKLSHDSILQAEVSRIYHNNYFYQDLLDFTSPVQSFNRSGDQLVVLSADGKANLYVTGATPPALVDTFKHVSAVHLNPSGSILLLGYSDGYFAIYNTELKKVQKTLKAHQQPITSLSFAATADSYIVTGSKDKTLQLFNKQYEKTNRLVGLRSGINSLSLNPKYGLIAASGDAEPRLWDFTGKLTLKLPTHPDTVTTIAISEHADRILTTSGENARMWDLKANLKALMQAHAQKITTGAFATKSNQSATGDRGGDIVLWDPNGKHLITLRGHTAAITRLEFSKNDRYLYSSSKDGTLKQWLLEKPAHLDFSVIDPLPTERQRKYKIFVR